MVVCHPQGPNVQVKVWCGVTACYVAALLVKLEQTTDFDAVTGNISYSADSHVPNKTVTIMGVQDGEFNFMTELTP